jgi:MFS family permease
MTVLFYGHGVVFACFTVMFLLYGSVLNTFTIFLNPIVDDLGWSRGALSVAMGVGAIGMALAAPIAGKLMDRIGAKPVMIAGTLMIGLGILGASRIMLPWQIYILYSLVGCGLACATVIPCSLIISNWFASRRGMAMGIMAMGTSTGGMLMSPFANWIILNYGWRAAYVFSGTVILVVGLPIIIFLLRARPSEAGLEPYVDSGLQADTVNDSWGLSVTEAFSASAFWQIAALMFVIGVVTSGLGAHIVPCLTDFGHSPTRSAYAWSVTLGVMTIAKFSFGPVADRWGPKNTMAGACGLMAISIVVLTFATPYKIAILFAALYGFGVGAPLTVNPLLVGEALGMKHFGALYGILNLISIVGAAIGPVALGIVFDKQGNYMSALYVFIALMACTGVIAFFISSASQRAGVARQGQPAGALD